MGKDERRLRQIVGYLHDLTRHLSKHDIMEQANFFGYDEDEDAGWNNNTVVYCLETMIQDWLREHWSESFTRYVELDRGLCPPEKATLQELGMLPQQRGRVMGEDEAYVVYGQRGLGKQMQRRYICGTRRLEWAQRIAECLAGEGDEGERFYFDVAYHWPMLEALAQQWQAEGGA